MLYDYSFSVSHDERGLITKLIIEWEKEFSSIFIFIQDYKIGMLVVPNNHVVSLIKRLKEDNTEIEHFFKKDYRSF